MRIRISFKEGFSKTAKALSGKQREKLAELIVLLSNDPFDDRLHVKALSGELKGIYSFRISQDWRVLFRFVAPEEIMVLEVGHRKDIYQ
jgi:addiction module RelE/StbE family toxin